MNHKLQLQIKNISYSYDGGKDVLKDVSLDIFAQEKIAVIGANGAGKSTFFLCMNGVLFPDKGEILLDEKKINNKTLNELRKNVGIVFQDAESQIIAPTVLAEVSFGVMNLKLPKEEVKKRTYKAMEYMNLLELADRGAHYLSGGEKKKVTIADIIAMKPKIIIFDEPTTALDPLNQELLENVLNKLSAEGKTLIVSTHDVDFAYRFADRIIVFFDGEIIADDTPVSVFSNKDVLLKSNLKQPILFQLKELLDRKGILGNSNNYPKSIKELEELL